MVGNYSLIPKEKRDPFIDFVIDKACEFTFTERAVLMSKSQTDEISFIRQMIMYTVKEVKPFLPIKVIAQHLNRKDHSTAIHSIRRITDLINIPKLNLVLHKTVMDFKTEIIASINSIEESEESFNQMIDAECEMMLNWHPNFAA